MPIFELNWVIPAKIHVWKFGLDWLKAEVFEFSGGRSPLLWGLHTTCDAHFRTCPSYSSQKSHVKIWFVLVEPFKSYCDLKKKKKKITDNWKQKKFSWQWGKKKKFVYLPFPNFKNFVWVHPVTFIKPVKENKWTAWEQEQWFYFTCWIITACYQMKTKLRDEWMKEDREGKWDTLAVPSGFKPKNKFFLWIAIVKKVFMLES